MNDQLRKTYKELFEIELLDEIIESGFHKKVKEGDTLIDVGNYIKSMPLLTTGAIKIMRVDNNGDELLLYFLEKGHTCATTMTCCMGLAKSEIRAVAEVDTELMMIPVQKMEEWTVNYKSWRDFVFQSYQQRLLEMLESIDSVAFHNMEERLKNYIQNKIAVINSKHIYITHQEIAEDLHTSRVVISRLLKKMEQEQKIKLHRSLLKSCNIGYKTSLKNFLHLSIIIWAIGISRNFWLRWSAFNRSGFRIDRWWWLYPNRSHLSICTLIQPGNGDSLFIICSGRNFTRGCG
tara:strand:- start:4327 stop:5199 length:873 start_codon:yes stop_codon:yes gene_type:complete